MRIKKHIKQFFFANYRTTCITLGGFLIVIGILYLEVSSLPVKVSPPTASKIVWAVFDGGGNRSGVNTFETLITLNTVANLQLLWQNALPYTTNGTPAEVPNVTTQSGIKDLLFVTTQKGSLVAIDAATGTKVWQQDTMGNFVGGQGTSSSPVVDASGQFVYSYGLDGKVHKYAVATGTEDSSKGFPVPVTVSTDVEKISAPLNIGNGYLYAVTSGYDGDFGQYVGHVVAVNLATGTTTVWNSLCSNVKQLSPAGFCGQKGSGIWGRAGAVVDSVTHNVFVVTGNGNYNASSGGHNYGDSIIELTSDLSQIVDTYTPSSYGALDSNDDDLGSTGVVLLPQQNNTTTPFLVVVGGKDQKVRLLNKQNLSGAGAPNHVGGELQTVAVNCQTLAHPVAWNDTTGTTWVFLSDTCATLYAYKVVNNGTTSRLQLAYQKNSIGKNSPFIADNLLFTPTSNNLSAVDPTTGNILWSSNTLPNGNIRSLHWQSPLVVNGAVYMPDDTGTITAYGLAENTSTPTTSLVSSTPSPTSVSISPTVQPTDTPVPSTVTPTSAESGSPTPNPSADSGSPTPTPLPVTLTPGTAYVRIAFNSIDANDAAQKRTTHPRLVTLFFYTDDSYLTDPDGIKAVNSGVTDTVFFIPSAPSASSGLSAGSGSSTPGGAYGIYTNAQFRLPQFPPGNYYVFARAEGSLREPLGSIPTKVTLNPPQGMYLDFTQNGTYQFPMGKVSPLNKTTITLEDYNAVVTCYGYPTDTKKTNDCQNLHLFDKYFVTSPFVDFNADGKVDGTDYTIFLKNFLDNSTGY